MAGRATVRGWWRERREAARRDEGMTTKLIPAVTLSHTGHVSNRSESLSPAR